MFELINKKANMAIEISGWQTDIYFSAPSSLHMSICGQGFHLSSIRQHEIGYKCLK